MEALPGDGGDWAEVRLLGPLRVRTGDNALLTGRAFGTTKNADLLRWLALHPGDPVSAETLAAGLWPDTDGTKARASLRTALAHVRRLLGHSAIERVGEGLALRGAWVDAGAFTDLVDDCLRRRREGRPAEAFRIAREADALYPADMPVGADTPGPLVRHAERLGLVRTRLLTEAAEIALELGWPRDALDIAVRLVGLDPMSEQASRTLMRAWAGLGETRHALDEYERCRRTLADELGVDPSPETQQVRLDVLQPSGAEARLPDLLGRDHEVAWLCEVLGGAEDAEGPGHRPAALVVLTGAKGSGRRRLAAAAATGCGLEPVLVDSAAALAARSGPGTVAIWQPDVANPTEVRDLLQAGGPRRSGPAVIVLPPVPDGELPPDVLHLELHPLVEQQVAALGEQVLGGPLTPALVDELVAASEGLPGAVIAVARRWQATSALVATSTGLALAPELPPLDPGHREALLRAVGRLDADAAEALRCAAVLDRPLTPYLLAPLLSGAGIPGAQRARVGRARAALDQLVDVGLLETGMSGAGWRHPLLRDAVYAWLRPVVRRRMHAHVASHGVLPSGERVQHWLQAGEYEAACLAALDAADEAMDAGDAAAARDHLLRVDGAGVVEDLSPQIRVRLLEGLGDASATEQCFEAAAEAYGRALDAANTQLLPEAVRLRRKSQAVADRVRQRQRPSSERQATWAPGPARRALAPDDETEAMLLDEVDQADRTHRTRAAVDARLALAGSVYLPRRDFRSAHMWLESVLAMSPGRGERLRAVILRATSGVLLGDARRYREPLAEAALAATEAGDEQARLRLLGLRTLVAHDLGDPDFATLSAELGQGAGAADDLVAHQLRVAALRIHAEREEPDLAAAMAAMVEAQPTRQMSPLHHLMGRLALAEYAELLGDDARAEDLVSTVVESGLATRCTLLVPEAAARLVVLRAERDMAGAMAAFEVFDDVVGVTLGGPREEYWRRLARAALRAASGEHDRAAAACAQADALAQRHGLHVLAARARRMRAACLRTAPVPSGLAAVHPIGQSRAVTRPLILSTGTAP